jgi:hypothetical protein
MEGLSAFTLILQGLARVDLESTYFPQPATRAVKLDATKDDALKKAFRIACNLPDSVNVNSVTVYIDPNGFLTPGVNQPAVARKVRVDNVGQNADLRSVIASSKSP